jgi:hypothetical protein
LRQRYQLFHGGSASEAGAQSVERAQEGTDLVYDILYKTKKEWSFAAAHF